MVVDQIEMNIEMLVFGCSFFEFFYSVKSLLDDYFVNWYLVLFYGVGLCDEYLVVFYLEDWVSGGYDGYLEFGMVVCVESYVGCYGGYEGVKLEEQLFIIEDGYEWLSMYFYDECLMGRQI